jgi:hypothetical protein
MINNAVGYRAASITDPWTGISRLSPGMQEGFQKVATVFLGNNAYKYLATSEKAIQAGVSVVKSTIVVRSIIIPMANLASNFMQLSLHGVNVREMYQGYQTKLLEITKYQKNLKRAIDIKAEITAQRTNPDAVRRLETELKSLEDSMAEQARPFGKSDDHLAGTAPKGWSPAGIRRAGLSMFMVPRLARPCSKLKNIGILA